MEKITAAEINSLGGEYKKAYDLGFSNGYQKSMKDNYLRFIEEDKQMLLLLEKSARILAAKIELAKKDD